MKVSIEQLEIWQKEARIYRGKIEEVEEMISRKLVGKDLGKRMMLVAEDDLEILISKLKNALEDAGATEFTPLLDKAKTDAPAQEIKKDLEEIVNSKGLGQPELELIQKHAAPPLDLIIEVAKKTLQGL